MEFPLRKWDETKHRKTARRRSKNGPNLSKNVPKTKPKNDAEKRALFKSAHHESRPAAHPPSFCTTSQVSLPMGSACRAPCVLPILRTFLLSDPLSSDPPNLSSFRSSDPPNPPSPGGGLPPPLPPPWRQLAIVFRSRASPRSHFSDFFDFWDQLFAKSKIIENLTSHETSPNPKNQTHGRSKVDFYTIYDDFWHPIYCLPNIQTMVL